MHFGSEEIYLGIKEHPPFAIFPTDNPHLALPVLSFHDDSLQNKGATRAHLERGKEVRNGVSVWQRSPWVAPAHLRLAVLVYITALQWGHKTTHRVLQLLHIYVQSKKEGGECQSSFRSTQIKGKNVE